MKEIFIIIVFISLTSCQSEEPGLGVYFSGGSKIEILDAEGNNRLNPNYSDPILLENLDLYFLIEGKRELYYDADMDKPKGLDIYFDEHHKKWLLSVPQNPHDLDNEFISISIVDFGDGTEGIIKGQWNKAMAPPSGGAFFVKKVWYNGELVYDGNEDLTFSIIR